jgi:hypothetical protein
MKPDDRTAMPPHPSSQAPPDPRADWCFQKNVSEALGISPQAASAKARAGELRHFEHGVRGCGRRKYSRALIQRELRRRWELAVQVQDQLMGSGEA